MSDLRKEFEATFDHLRSSFAGLDSHSQRVVYGIELIEELQRSLFAYIVNQGPKPTLTIENAAYGHYGSINGASEGEFPRVVQQQANGNNNTEGNGLPAVYVTNNEEPTTAEWPADPDGKIRTLADRLTDVMTRDKGVG